MDDFKKTMMPWIRKWTELKDRDNLWVLATTKNTIRESGSEDEKEITISSPYDAIIVFVPKVAISSALVNILFSALQNLAASIAFDMFYRLSIVGAHSASYLNA